MRKRIKYIFHSLFGRTQFSSIWGFLHKLSLKGLNYGYSDNPRNSGEISVIELLKGRRPMDGHQYTLVNVGANEGQYFHLFKKIILNYTAILFEPSIKCYEVLNKYVEKNTKIFNLAVGEKKGFAELFYDIEGSVQGSLLKSGSKKSQKVEVVTLDDALNNNLYIDLLVIDTEGFEKNVLLGANNLIMKQKIQMIQFEHGSEYSILNKTYLRDFFEILHQYDIYHIKQNGIKKIVYTPDKEIFYNTNYLAILK